MYLAEEDFKKRCELEQRKETLVDNAALCENTGRLPLDFRPHAVSLIGTVSLEPVVLMSVLELVRLNKMNN